MHHFYLILAGLLFLASCKKDEPKVDETDECPYGNSYTDITNTSPSVDGLMPMYMTSRWIYVDSVFDSETGEFWHTRDIVIEPLEAKITGEDIWWNFEEYFGPTFITQDTIYTLGNQWPSPCKVKVPLFFQPDTDTTQMSISLDGSTDLTMDIWKIKAPVNVPAGTFQNAWYFAVHKPGELPAVGQVFEPGVGFLETIYYDSEGRVRNKRSLVNHTF